MALAIFDLDNTLLNGDSDHAWGEFLAEQQVVDPVEFKAANEQFYQDYLDGVLNIDNFLSFSLKPLAENSLEHLKELHALFMQEKIQPIRSPGAEALLQKHRDQGDFLLIISATNRFIIDPIAEMLGVDDVLGTIPEFDGKAYTGKVVHPPCFREGKITHLEQWLKDHPEHSLTGSYFYSDSHNDLPLLEKVDFPNVVNGDEKLLQTAKKNNWPCFDFQTDS